MEGRRDLPPVIRIEPSSACNLRCIHCPTGTVAMARGVMKQETFEALLSQIEPFADAIRIVVLYHGGEPLVNRHFSGMVKRLKEIRIRKVKTVSNGMLLTEKAALEVLDSGLDAIEFSLDGTSEQENDRVRANGDFRAVSQNVKRLIALKKARGLRRPDVYISTTRFITEETMRDRTPPEPADYLQSEFEDVAADLAGFKATYAMQWPDMAVDPDAFDLLQDEGKVKDVRSCSYAEETITVRANGDVVPCCYDLTSRLTMGNILQRPLIDIWNGPEYQRLREQFRTATYNDTCRRCNVVRPDVYLVRKETSDARGGRGVGARRDTHPVTLAL